MRFIIRAFVGLISAWLAVAVPSFAQDVKPLIEPEPQDVSSDSPKTGVPEQDNDARERLEWLRELYGGDLRQDFARRVFDEAAKARSQYPGHFVTGAPSPNSWRNLGPTGSNKIQNGVTLQKVNSGRLRGILPDPTDPNTVYVLGASGGLWKTTNFLDAQPRWVPKTDFVGSTTGGAAVFGQSPNTIYLGTGDPFDVGAGGFVLRSTDGGDTWSAPFALGTANLVLDLKVDTSIGHDIVLAGTNAGLFRSVDGGVTYTDVGAPLAGLKVWSLARTSAGWLAEGVTQDEFGDDIAGSLFISTDRGSSWSPIPNAGNVFSSTARATLAVGASGDPVVYAFAAGVPDADFNYPQRDLFRSTDGGLNWVALHINAIIPFNANPDAPDMRILGSQAWYNQMLLLDPTDPSRNTVYLGGQLASAKSEDGGATWTILTDWLAFFGMPYVHADFHAAAFSSLGGVRRIFLGSDGGLFTSTDGGLTWDDTKNRGLITHQPYTIASNPVAGNTDTVLMGLQDNGTILRVGNSSIFDQTLGGDGMGTGWSQANNAISMTSVPGGAIYRSTNNPPNDLSKWQRATTGLSGPASFYTLVANAEASADPTGLVFYTTRNNAVFRTTNGGTNWSAILTQGVGGVSPDRGVRPGLFSVGTSPVDTQHLAVIGNTRFWISTTGGAPWTELNLSALIPGWQERGTSSAAWANNNLLYVSSETTLAGATHFAKSTDGGATWIAPLNFGLPDLPVGRVRIDPSDATGNTLYAATWIGVYKTTNGGDTWEHFGAGLPQVPIHDIYIAPGGAYLRVAAYGRGAWEVMLTPPPNATITTVASAVQGQRDLIASAPVQPGASYVWDIDGGTITSGTYDSVLIYRAGSGSSLTLSLSVTNGAGALASSSVIVPLTPAPPPDATITAPSVTSQGATGVPASVPAQIGATYAWSIAGGQITSLTNGPAITFTAGADPNVVLQVVVVNGAGMQQIGIKRIAVVAAPLPDATITADLIVPRLATGLHASVPIQLGATYAWTIDGGGITSRTDVPSITYSAGDGRTLTVNVTVTNANGVALSASRVIAIQRTGQYLGNPGFESGNAYWHVSDPSTINNYGSLNHSGTRAALLNSYGFANTATLWQSVTVPADAYSARLRFWLRVVSADGTGIVHDTLTVQIRDDAGVPLETLAIYSNRNRSSFYTWRTFDLSAYRGQTIRIYFEGTENASLFTGFALDDFGLDVVTPPAPSGDYLLNGNFEAGLFGWEGLAAGSTFFACCMTLDPTLAHSGSWVAFVSGYGFAATDTLFQRVTIPDSATSATFSYWLSVQTDEVAPVANDVMTVQVLDAHGNLLQTLASYSNLDAGPYAQHTFDLSAYRGQTILLFVRGTENASLQTSFLLDDMALQVTTPAAPIAPIAAITAPATAGFRAAGLVASVPDQPGDTYTWTINGGTITAGAGTHAITFDAGPVGTLTLEVVVTNQLGSSRGTRLIQVLHP